MLTAGNVDDRKPVPKMVRKFFGKLFADKDNISKSLREELLRTFNIHLVTGIRANESTWVQNELSRPMSLRKPLIPLLLEGDTWLSVESIQ
jgi:hypothetical protein